MFVWFYLVCFRICKESKVPHQSINPILIQVYPRKQGWLDLPHSNSNLSNSHSISISLDSWHPPSPDQHFCSPSPLVSSTSSLVVLTSSCPSFQTSMLFSKHSHHPSSPHAARTISLHSPFRSEPLFPSIPTSPNILLNMKTKHTAT